MYRPNARKDMTNTLFRNISIIVTALCMILTASVAKAFDVSTYTETSALAEGRWVKVSVTASGMYLIPTSSLRSWGFSDPSKVRIHGYGGARISDVLSAANYIDDLPEVPSEVTSKGIVFYAQGVETWTASGNYYVHSLNPFSTVGYYFLTESDADATNPVVDAGTAGATNPATSFLDYLYHETDEVKLGETGHLLLGEDFKYTPSRTFNFTLTDIDTNMPVRARTQFVAKTYSSSSRLTFSVNGTQQSSTTSDVISASGTSTHTHGVSTVTTKSFYLTDSKLQLGIAHSASVTVVAAYLDFIEINYTRQLKLSDGQLTFNLSQTQARLDGATTSTRIWDVTNPLKVYQMRTSASGSGVAWTNDYTGTRRYAAWDETATMPSPTYVGTVNNQNLHDPSVTPDMVIFSPTEWSTEAERIAAMHRDAPDSLTVLVVNPAEVYNEFGSGVPDVNTFRRYLKMLYDRGKAAGHPLRFALLMGKPTYDNRRLTAAISALSYQFLPTWQSDTSLDDNVSFTTDDIFSFLKDNSGSTMASDSLCIAVGRIPVRTASDAKTAVDKLYEYVNSSKRSSWQNQMLFVADDENNGIHMEQTDAFINAMVNGNDDGTHMMITKVYIDAFTKRDGGYPEARTRMYNRLDEGAMWWNFVGHANPTGWTGENILTYNDINNLYLRRYPILYAATCEFLNWDAIAMSGAEILYYTRQGGIIAAITAVRPVYITDNGLLGTAMGPHIMARGDDGRFLPLGEMYRRGKNNIRDSYGVTISNSNKLRFVLMGDPAMRPVTPANRVKVETIGGVEPTEDAQVTIKARQVVTVEGSVTDWQGNPLPDFNGDVTLEIYDAEYSTTSNGNGAGKRYTFEEQGERLYSGRDTVQGGKFTITVAMPEDVANNFRPGAMNLYATASTSHLDDAMGTCRTFYVYGYDTTAEADTTAPAIETMYLNHPTFNSGDRVNPSPLLIATVSDNLGFNLSTAGVGHTMTLQLDGKTSYTDVSNYFTPDMGSLSGTIAYPFEDLQEGRHTLRLRVWDTQGNLAEQTIDFVVSDDVDPVIYRVYTDSSPASTEANFYVSHNRPDQMMTFSVEVFNLMGRKLWESSATGISDMYTSVPVTWDLCDSAGRRVQRGIYLFRATITESDGTRHVTESSRLAVSAQ